MKNIQYSSFFRVPCVTSLDVITMGLNFSVVSEGDTSKSIPRKEPKGYDRESERTN
nr:MAG TPA: hypothetical protein [Caudoviricetes sp.]